MRLFCLLIKSLFSLFLSRLYFFVVGLLSFSRYVEGIISYEYLYVCLVSLLSYVYFPPVLC